jgi:hypothetical protein
MIDLTQMIKNLAKSLESVEQMLTAVVYLMGVGLMIAAIFELKAMGVSQHSDPQERIKSFLKLTIGAFFVYLPTTLSSFSQTFFGQGSVVSYDNYNPVTIYSSMKVIFKVAGIIWFARGSMMLYNIDETSHREKNYMSLTYVFAGILAINVDYAVSGMTYIVNQITHWL